MGVHRKYHPKPMEEIIPQEWAYAAGLLDGEGTINIWQQKTYRQFVLRIQVANSCREALEWLRARFGGSIHKNCGGRYVNLTVYSWQLSARLADAFLKGCAPFSIMKKDQIEVALRLYSEGAHEKGQNALTPAEFERRQGIRLALRQVRLDKRLPRGDKVVKPLITWN